MTVRILQGDCRDVLKTLPDQSVHCCVTSPPYFGLRDYGVEGQIGLEPTPAEFVSELVTVFREVRRVLRDDGTLWLNLGDTYATNGGAHGGREDNQSGVGAKRTHDNGAGDQAARRAPSGLKPKDLIGIPWRVAFALQADGWWLRQDIIWHKPNPMPESVTDRCTKAHEYVFLLSKSERYHFDTEAMQEPASGLNDYPPQGGPVPGQPPQGRYRESGNKARKPRPGAPESHGGEQAGSVPWAGATRNKRSVWTIATKPFAEAHFATMAPELAETCIKAGCPEGGVVLDPFGGAGTTGLVADRLQRSSVLIELNAEYQRIASRRIAGDAPLFTDVEVIA